MTRSDVASMSAQYESGSDRLSQKLAWIGRTSDADMP
jgi:hypothetical protein